jgi:hypothetical protein
VRSRSFRRFAFAAALLWLAGACASPPGLDSERVEATPVPTAAPATFEIDRAMEHVRVLAVDIGRREAGTEGDERARQYVREQLEAIGWEAEEQFFDLPQGGQSANVLGLHPGSVDHDRWVLFGGHLDSIGGPGANDNATGVAIALEIARVLNETVPSLRLGMVAFGAEERQPAPGRPHHIGSLHYVANLGPGEREGLVSFVNLDMVGNGDLIYCGRMSVGPTEGTERCVQTADDLGIRAEERVTPNWSDNGSFLAEGMNAAWLWTGEVPCCYHNELDNFDNVIPDDMEQAGELALALIRSYLSDE